MQGISGSATILSGAGRGIGLAVAQRLLEEGGKVYALDVDPPPFETVASGRLSWHSVDVADEKAVDVFFRDNVTPGAVGALINCAGTVERGSILDTSLDQWEAMLRLNLSSMFLMTRAFVDNAPREAAIVNVSSVDAHHAHPERLGYAVAKGGVEALTRLAASQLAPRGIRVNAVVPGAIATRMTPDANAGNTCVLRRRGTAEEVANAIVFLVSAEASYVTGATLRVDGGFGLR